MVDTFDITKIEKPKRRKNDSNEYFQQIVMERRSDAYHFARHGRISKIDEFLDERKETSKYFSESEKKYLKQIAKINFLPLALKRLETNVKGKANTYSSLINEIYRGNNFDTSIGMRQILDFYELNNKHPENRISAESLRLKKRLLAITEAAHRKSETMKNIIKKEIKERL